MQSSVKLINQCPNWTASMCLPIVIGNYLLAIGY